MNEIKPILAKLPVRKVVRKEASSQQNQQRDLPKKSDKLQGKQLKSKLIIDEYA